MRRRNKAKGILAKVANEQATEKTKQIIEKQIRKLVVRKQILEPVPEIATTSRANPIPEHPPSFYSRLKDAFESAFYNDNDEVKIPKIQSIYTADYLKPKCRAIPKSRLNNENDIEDTLIILRAFELQALNVQESIVEEVEEKRLTAGHVLSPYIRVRLAKLSALRECIRKDTKVLHEQLRNSDKNYKKHIKVGDTLIIIDSNGEQISVDDYNNLIDKKKNPTGVILPRKTHDEIKMEFKGAFCVNIIPELENIYSRQNTGELETNCSSERRNAQEHCEILSKLIKVMESDLLNNVTNDIVNEIQNFDAESESLYNVDPESDLNEKSKLLLNDTNTIILVNADGDEISDPEFNRFIINEISL